MPASFFTTLSSWRSTRSFLPGALWLSPWMDAGGIRWRYVIARVGSDG